MQSLLRKRYWCRLLGILRCGAVQTRPQADPFEKPAGNNRECLMLGRQFVQLFVTPGLYHCTHLQSAVMHAFQIASDEQLRLQPQDLGHALLQQGAHAFDEIVGHGIGRCVSG
ncbi:hypothetical protein D3C84_724590 [compost metagenome]